MLDPDFPDRLKLAIDNVKVTVPEVSRAVGCTRAVLHKYLNGNAKTIEALLLFELADSLKVSARWLLTGAGAMARGDTPYGDVALQTIRRIVESTPRPHNERKGESGYVERRRPTGGDEQPQG